MAPPPNQSGPNPAPDQPDKQPARPATPENHNGSNGHARPALKRTIVKPSSPAPDPVDGAFVANRLTTLVHELSTLLDASMRVIGLARRSLTGLADVRAIRDTNGNGASDDCPEKLERQLETVDAAIRQMAELVRSTMIGMAANGAAGIRDGFGASSSLADAVRHAAEVMTPLAEECCVQMETQIALELSEIPAGPIYPVIINGVRNAIESIRRVGDQYVGGRVCVRAWAESGTTGRCVMITIEDDGKGLVPHGRRDDWHGKHARESGPSRADASVFRLGYTTKPGGSGIGLSLCRDVIEQLGGTIELLARPRDPGSGRGGAVLSVCYPVPRVG